MSKPLTHAEQAAWDAIGHDREHWTAVQKALKAVAPIHADQLSEIIREWHIQMADAGLVFTRGLADAFPDAVQIDPASPPQSTETPEPVGSDDPSTPDAVEAATAWLLRDHDERVETGTVRPARERAAELVAVVRAADEAQPMPAVDIPAWREMGDHSGG